MTISTGSVPTRLVLWDVDGTLIHPGPGVIAAYEQAVAAAVAAVRDPSPSGGGSVQTAIGAGGLGVDEEMKAELTVGGLTDPQVCLTLLQRAGLGLADADGLLPIVLLGVEERIAASLRVIQEEGRVMPGVPEILARLHGEPGILQSVVTGNTVVNARTKLSAFGLTRWLALDAGAFGSDDQDRRALVGVALARIRERRGLTFAPDRVWVVGDTPHDLACARAGGVRCALVSTGHYSFEELGELAPDALLPDLTDTDRLAALLAS